MYVDHSFYSDPKYKDKQSKIAQNNWKRGVYGFRINNRPLCLCQNPVCSKLFAVFPHDLNKSKYCSRSCSVVVNNHKRRLTQITKSKISIALKGRISNSQRKLVLKKAKECQNPICRHDMYLTPWEYSRRKYCSNLCAMRVIGGRTTSPRASKGKSGVRNDIDSDICFYSTWEANVARMYNLVGIKWSYSPKIFDLGEHNYRPDFYLSDFGIYVEVKNYMNDYSQKRDFLFRQMFRDIPLVLILRKEYEEIKADYAKLIDRWEY